MAICLHLMAVTFGCILNLIINVPPRTSKSRIFTMFWPAWEYARGMKSRFLFTGNDQDLVIEMSVECRRIIESEKFQRWFPTSIETDQNTKVKFDLQNGGRRQITSVNSKTTGKGGNRLGVDDIHDADNNAAKFLKEVEWFCGTWISRGDPSGFSMVVMGQCLDYNDLSMYLMREQPDLWVRLCLPLFYDPDRHCRNYLGDWYGWWEDPRKEPGENLWPAVFTEHRLSLLRRTMSTRKFRAQFQQDPLPDGGQEFKSEWLSHRWKRLLVRKVDRFFFSADTSFKGKETSDWCVIGLFAKIGPFYYLIGIVREKMDYPTLKKRIVTLHSKWRDLGVPVSTTIVEDKANGTALIAEMERKIPGIVPFSPKDDKIVRYRAISGILEAGQFLLPDEEEGAVLVNEDGLEIQIDTTWIMDFIAELLAIPGGTHDDQADMLAQGILYCEGQGGEFEAEQWEEFETEWSEMYG